MSSCQKKRVEALESRLGSSRPCEDAEADNGELSAVDRSLLKLGLMTPEDICRSISDAARAEAERIYDPRGLRRRSASAAVEAMIEEGRRARGREKLSTKSYVRPGSKALAEDLNIERKKTATSL